MLFFNKKKEETAEIPKYKFLVNLKDDEIEVIKLDYLLVNHQKLQDIYAGMIANIQYDCLLTVDKCLKFLILLKIYMLNEQLLQCYIDF